MEGVGARDVSDALRREFAEGKNSTRHAPVAARAHSPLAVGLGGAALGLLTQACSKPGTRGSVATGSGVAQAASVRGGRESALEQRASREGGTRCQIGPRADGTVKAAIPDYLQNATDLSTGHLVSGEGNWKLNADAGYQHVELRISKHADRFGGGEKVNGSRWTYRDIVAGATTSLRVELSENGIELRFW